MSDLPTAPFTGVLGHYERETAEFVPDSLVEIVSEDPECWVTQKGRPWSKEDRVALSERRDPWDARYITVPGDAEYPHLWVQERNRKKVLRAVHTHLRAAIVATKSGDIPSAAEATARAHAALGFLEWSDQ